MIFQVCPGLKSLNQVRAKYVAENGDQGRSFHRTGKNGKSKIIKVPSGSIIRDEKGEVVVELSHKNISTFVAARGGKGGKGNYYYLSNDNKKPKEFENGHPGQHITYNLELKLIADAALVNNYKFL